MQKFLPWLTILPPATLSNEVTSIVSSVEGFQGGEDNQTKVAEKQVLMTNCAGFMNFWENYTNYSGFELPKTCRYFFPMDRSLETYVFFAEIGRNIKEFAPSVSILHLTSGQRSTWFAGLTCNIVLK